MPFNKTHVALQLRVISPSVTRIGDECKILLRECQPDVAKTVSFSSGTRTIAGQTEFNVRGGALGASVAHVRVA
jgi:hypothetical protein